MPKKYVAYGRGFSGSYDTETEAVNVVMKNGFDGMGAVYVRLDAIQHTLAVDLLHCGHKEGIVFGESSWNCAVCGEPASH